MLFLTLGAALSYAIGETNVSSDQQTSMGCLSLSAAELRGSCSPRVNRRLHTLNEVVPNREEQLHVKIAITSILDTIESIIGFRPIVLFYYDSYPNALAAIEATSHSQKGKIYIGYQLLSKILSLPNSGFLLAGILAHEAGHLYQVSTTLCRQLLCGDRVLEVELHADFLAGFILKQSGVAISTEDANVLVKGWKDLGDKSHSFNNQASHGTATQRVEMIKQGFEAGEDSSLTFMEIAESGAMTINKKFICGRT